MEFRPAAAAAVDRSRKHSEGYLPGTDIPGLAAVALAALSLTAASSARSASGAVRESHGQLVRAIAFPSKVRLIPQRCYPASRSARLGAQASAPCKVLKHRQRRRSRDLIAGDYMRVFHSHERA